MDNKLLLIKLKNADIVVRKSITLRSGKATDYYIDIKKVYGNSTLLYEIGQAVAKSLDPKTTCLAVSGYGGIPLGVVVSQITELPLSLVRIEEKNHGKSGLIDGYNPNEKDRVSVLDDVFTTGSSLAETIKVLAEEGIGIAGCNVVIARDETSNFPYVVSYLFKSNDLV